MKLARLTVKWSIIVVLAVIALPLILIAFVVTFGLFLLDALFAWAFFNYSIKKSWKDWNDGYLIERGGSKDHA